MSLPRRRVCSLRRRGPPRQGCVRLSEPGDKFWGLSGPLRLGVACPGEGGLRLGELVTA